ncbi:anthranilate synthase component I family protein [Sporosarcina ureilytica]|uniref:Aminodeoxychorismate synthase component I n=1 Tax=Sporosarcina ureilytica TaxID=298596 RepID=A0A1D8JC60_9BACL|nr:anthranilate synthase component I family protein [Sporosarcina ureilytica]AOV06290.1 aminodeoxychorismate synthase component I [Sporosarcina ureilytica]
MKKQQVPAYTAKEMSTEQFFNAYQQLAQTEQEHILLESGRDGKFSIAGVNPLAKIVALDGELLQIVWRNGKEELLKGDPLENLMKFVQSYKIDAIPGLPVFQGGIIGFISYDYVRRYESLPDLTKRFAETPDLYFYLFDEWVVHDIQKEQAYFMSLPESAIDTKEVAKKWLDAAEVAERNVFMLQEEVPTDDLQVSVNGPEFEKMVEDVQAYIEKGDVVQVNLSVRQSKPFHVTPLAYYEALRQVNPSPYMACIGAEKFSVASSSPELLVKRRGNELATRPIGGTRRRGTTEAEDLANEKDLLSDEKEKAEHIMLVELEKEDFSRVCEPKTVETNEFMVVERYSHVMHLVSNVRGVVAEGQTNADIVKAIFPGGTITGAPKVRTMEIIEELEPEKRGLYTGSIGWFGFNGDFELNVVIRTAFIQDEVIHIQAGAGLVADSVPKDEYIESLAKGQALWQAKATVEMNRR